MSKPIEPKCILSIRGVRATWDGTAVAYTSDVAIDGDGSPRCYGPGDTGLDHTASAGHSGNWWALVTDPLGHPIVQGPGDPYPGMYVSMTTYGRPHYPDADPRKWVNAEIVPYIVIPAPLRSLIEPTFIGCRAVITNARNGRQIEAVVADVGPGFGEISIAAAKALGIPSDPRSGGTSDACLKTVIYPGQSAVINGERYELQPMG